MKKLLPLFIFIFSFTISKSQSLEWSMISGSNVWGMEFDSKANMYYSGVYSGVTDLDPGAGITTVPAYGGYYNISFCKLDSARNFVWARSIGGTLNLYGAYMSIDSSDNLYFAGSFDGTADLDPSSSVVNYTSAGASDVFIISIDTAGNTVWTKKIGGSGDESIRGVLPDNNGDIYIWGNFAGTVDFNPGVGIHNITAIGSYAAFICKLTSSGNFVWAKQISNSAAYDLKVDSLGNIFATGAMDGTANFDPTGTSFSMTSFGMSDMFICKFGASGNFIWAKQMGGPRQDIPTGIVIDNDYNIIYTGNFRDTCDFDPGLGIYNLMGSPTSTDVFVSKLDSAGNFIWGKQFEGGGGTGDYSNYIYTDNRNNIYTSGSFSGTVDFDPGIGIVPLSSAGHDDVFLCKLNEDGNHIWSGRLGSPVLDGGGINMIDDFENIYFSGYFNDTADLDPSSGVFDSPGPGKFMLKLSQNVCSDMSLNIDSAKNKDCSSMGYALASSSGGYAPYSYSWNTTPITNDSVAFFSTDGIYQISVTDINGCSRSTSLLINGPYAGVFDLEANLITMGFRPGTASKIWLDGLNNGCTITSGNLTLILDSLTIYDSASVIPTIISGDTLTWNFTDLAYDSLHILPRVYVSIPTYAFIGDTVDFKIIMSPSLGDFDTTNNIKNYSFPIVAAYDPNDKKVYPPGECTSGNILNSQLLTYTVRFQNTGTASAINVFVLDTIDSDLDLSSVRVIANSDPLITEVLSGNVLKFKFDNIMLPDSTSDEPGSHGYVIFEIEPQPSLANGTEIKNDVGIYFDFNAPIYTNTVLNTISDGILNTNISLSFTTLTAGLAAGTYQWIDCNNSNLPIAGETNQTFNITTNGSYAVIVSDGCLTDTSACVNFNTIEINELNSISNFSIYPNPSQNNISITTTKPTELFISNLLGEVVLKSNVIDKSVIDISQLNNGVYFIRNSEGNTIKFIKQ